MSLIGQLVFDGLVTGLVFVVLAAGLVLITSVNKMLFMAYGMFYTIGAYSVWYAVDHIHLPYGISLFIALLIAGLLGILCYILIFNRLRSSEGGFLATLIASMGLNMVLNQGNLLAMGTLVRGIPQVFPGALNLFGIHIGFDKVVLILLSIAVTVALFWIYEKTKIGRAMRSVSFHTETASLQGVNVTVIYMLTLGIGTILAGFAGGILAPSYGLNPSMGANILWTVMLLTMLGGMDSLLGSVVGGIIVGQVLSFGQFYIGGIVQIFLFLAIGLVLYFKPAGLLGRGFDIEV